MHIFQAMYLLQQTTGHSWTLVFMVTSAGIGGTLQYGYNLAIMNAPTVVRSEHFILLKMCVCGGMAHN